MADKVLDCAPRALGRLAGSLYLFIMVAAIFAEVFVRGRLVVGGDPAATIRNLVVSETLWRWGVAANVATTVCDVAIAGLFFILLRPVGRGIALCAAMFRMAYSMVMAANAALLLVPLAIIGDAHKIGGPDAAVIQSLVGYSLRLHGAGFEVGLVFFGVHIILIGVSIARSRFLPRSLGAPLMIAGVCYMLNSFLGFVAPKLESGLFPWILLPGFLAEGALTLWLLIAGVNPGRWKLAREMARS